MTFGGRNLAVIQVTSLHIQTTVSYPVKPDELFNEQQ